VPLALPWEFQLAWVMFKGLRMEYQFKKKKETPDNLQFYEQMQSLAD